MVPINIRNVVFCALLIAVCLILPACDWFDRYAEANIDTSYKNLYLIDVNDKELHNDARIAGSINIAYDDLEEISKKLDKNYDIVFYCTDYACTESDRATKLMRSLGFEKVFVYSGGIHEWYLLSLDDSKDYRIEGPANQKFLSKPINKFERGEINAISASELSKLLSARKID